jgi:hypothetical protein
MMEIVFYSYVPAAIIVYCNVFGGKHGTLRHEKTTAYFGWIAAIMLLPSMFFSIC